MRMSVQGEGYGLCETWVAGRKNVSGKSWLHDGPISPVCMSGVYHIHGRNWEEKLARWR